MTAGQNNVTSAIGGEAPFNGTWERTLIGFAASSAPSGLVGAIDVANCGGGSVPLVSIGQCFGGIILVVPVATPKAFFGSIAITLTGGTTHTYNESAATYVASVGANGTDTPGNWNYYLWSTANTDFANGQVTNIVWSGLPGPIGGQGDITSPGAWQDANGNIPPLSFQNVPANTNYPLNGDGRYWWEPSAFAPNGVIQTFIGDTTLAQAGYWGIQWSIQQVANDGSEPFINYSLNGGSTWTSEQIGPSLQHNGLVSGWIKIPLSTAVTEIQFYVSTTGGTASSSATPWQVAVALTRNVNEGLTFDTPNPFNAANFNANRLDLNGQPSDTLANLRNRMIIRLGYPNQATNPPPGMAVLINDFLFSAQAYLWRTYNALQTARFFRWKINPLQRFYSLIDNDDDPLSNFHIDPQKTIEWAGIQDTRDVWYPLIEGIPPQLYTMITKPWRPARYTIRQCIELYPAPDQTYFLWIRANFGLMSFVNDSDTTTIDSNLVFYQALADAKAHYGQPDAENYANMANNYRGQLIAGTHGTSSYIPGTIAVPPAVRPTLIQYQDNQGA